MITRFFKISKPFHYILFLLAVTFIFFTQHGNKIWTVNAAEGLKLGITFLCFLLSVFLLVFIITKNRLTQNNSFAAFYFCLFIFLFPDSINNYEIVISNMFMLLAFRRIISMNTKTNLKKKYFDTGLWLCIAVFFYSLSALYIIPFLATILLWRTDRFKHFIVFILGISSVLFINLLLSIIFNVSAPEIAFKDLKLSFDFLSLSSFQLKFSFFVFFTLAGCSVIKIINETILKNKPSRPLFIIILLIFFSSIMMALISNIYVPQNFLFSFFPISVIAANFTQDEKSNWISNLIIVVIIGLSLFNISINFLVD